jgi:hypothetical protein
MTRDALFAKVRTALHHVTQARDALKDVTLDAVDNEVNILSDLPGSYHTLTNERNRLQRMYNALLASGAKLQDVAPMGD